MGTGELLQEGSAIQPDSAVHKLQIEGAKRNLLDDRVFCSDIFTEEEMKGRRPTVRKARSVIHPTKSCYLLVSGFRWNRKSEAKSSE